MLFACPILALACFVVTPLAHKRYTIMLRSIILACLVFSHFKAPSQDLIADPNLIKSIYFGGGSYYIDHYQRLELSEFINSFKEINNYNITVHSYTDDIGTDEYNQLLSEMRGNMTIRELLELGVSREKIEIHDFGEFNPVYDNSTLEGRLRNRRVDIILWPIEHF